jgi:hypothetical protein
MISADHAGKYRLHVSAGAWGRQAEGGSNYYSKHWQWAVVEKVRFAHGLLNLRDDNSGEYVVGPRDALLFTDLDVLPLGFYSQLKQTHEIMFMAENPIGNTPGNTGFYMAKNTNATRAFFAEWHHRVDQCESMCNDQLIGNIIMMEPSWRKVLDVGIWSSTNLERGYWGRRCAAIFDVKLTDVSKYTSPNRTHTRCAAVHAIASGKSHQKLDFLLDAYNSFVASHPIKNIREKSVNQNNDRCFEVTYGDIAAVYKDPPPTLEYTWDHDGDRSSSLKRILRKSTDAL